MNIDKLIEIAQRSYINVYGENKWNSLTAQERHDATMIILKDFGTALNELEKRI